MGFYGHLWRRFKEEVKRERVVYNLERRLVNPRIERPFHVKGAKNIHIGRDVMIMRNCLFHGGGMAWSQGKGQIKIGDNCWFGENCILYGAGGIEIGDNTGFGLGISVFSSRDNYALEHARKDHIVHYFGKVTIGPWVRIFSNAIISPGVTIGEGAIVGAGSVVLNDVPPWTIVAGSPAKVVGARDRDKRAEASGPAWDPGNLRKMEDGSSGPPSSPSPQSQPPRAP
jgi:acetyltransferase-like isoleucine patch superfamily enzyme